MSQLVRSSLLFLVSAAVLSANTLVLGTEALPKARTDNDFNDLIFRIEGPINYYAPSASLNSLTPGVVTGSGTTFFDGYSGDGWNANIGFCLLGGGSCAIDKPAGEFEFLANHQTNAALEVVFEAHGPLTVTMLGKFASTAIQYSLGWYNPDRPDELHAILAGTDYVGTTHQFEPNGAFALYLTNGNDQFYSSIASDNVNDAGDYQHFALFQKVGAPAPFSAVEDVRVVPEPQQVGAMLVAFALLAAKSCGCSLNKR